MRGVPLTALSLFVASVLFSSGYASLGLIFGYGLATVVDVRLRRTK